MIELNKTCEYCGNTFHPKRRESEKEFMERRFCTTHIDMEGKDFCMCCQKEIDSFEYPFCNRNCEDKYYSDIR